MSMKADNDLRSRGGYSKVSTDSTEKSVVKAKQISKFDVWEQRRERLTKVLSWIKHKVEALLWVGAAAYCVYYTNFFKVIFTHSDINQFFLSLSLMCVGINVCLATYVSIILPYVLHIKESFETYCPKVVYIGAFSGFLGFITMLLAIWPVWGFWSPLILLVMFMGYMMSGQLLPNNKLGSFIFAGIFIFACISYKFIDHEGKAH